ncbi:hypothetical protein GW17_00031335 [Ensete ventricosum]|nr:hypothetical protein GW17_00031335 [Ensete ventricosum]
MGGTYRSVRLPKKKRKEEKKKEYLVPAGRPRPRVAGAFSPARGERSRRHCSMKRQILILAASSPCLSDFRLSKGLCESLLVAKKNIADHAVKLKNRKTRAVLDSASAARSRLRSKLQQQQQQFRESSEVELEKGRVVSSRQSSEDVGQSKSCDISPGGRRMWSEASKAAGGGG